MDQMHITFDQVAGDRRHLLPLLLLADESRAMLEAYINDGVLFAIRDGAVAIGVLLLIAEGDAVEVKYMAVAEERQGQGIGRRALGFAAAWAHKAGAARLVVGTANSSLDAIRFYQRSGFRMVSVRRGSFDAYPEPIREHGIQARDMLLFSMDLEGFVPAVV